MDGDRRRFRAALFEAVSRLLHWTGLIALLRALANRPRPPASGRRLARPTSHDPATRNAQILTYHRVNDDGDPIFPGLPTAVFERQMGYLAAHHHVMPLSELVAALRDRTVPDNAVAVTFDDGYHDNYACAFPILRRHSIPATIFLVTSAVGTGRPIWHDDVFSAFRETSRTALEPFGPDSVHGPLVTTPDRLRTQRGVLNYLRTLPQAERLAQIAHLRRVLGVEASPSVPGLMLSWDEVREMGRGGIRFGSHTVSHPILSRVDRIEASRELVESKAAIEEHLGVHVDGFAYPNGTRADFLPETKELLRDAGYGYAVTTLPGSNTADTDVFELRRGTPWDHDVFAFGVRLLYNKWRS